MVMPQQSGTRLRFCNRVVHIYCPDLQEYGENWASHYSQSSSPYPPLRFPPPYESVPHIGTTLIFPNICRNSYIFQDITSKNMVAFRFGRLIISFWIKHSPITWSVVPAFSRCSNLCRNFYGLTQVTPSASTTCPVACMDKREVVFIQVQRRSIKGINEKIQF